MGIKEKIINKLNDNIIDYPVPANTGSKLKDKIFDWVVSRYKKNNHPWKKSDQRVFHGAIYGLSTYFGYIIFAGIMWWLFTLTQNRYGDTRAILLAMLIILIRINMTNKQLIMLNKKF